MNTPERPPELKKIFSENQTEVFKLLNTKELINFVTEINKEYLHWDELRYKKIPQNTEPKLVWAIAKMIRISGYKLLKFSDKIFKYNLLGEALRRLHKLDISSAGQLKIGEEFVIGSECIHIEGKERYIISALMEEAIASSQLEGAVTTRKIAKEFLKASRKPRNYSEHMIVNGYSTMQKIRELKTELITPDLILQLHKEITQDTLKDKMDEGRFRDSDDVVVGDPFIAEKVFYQPPDYKKIPQLIDEFCKFANDDKQPEFIHPVIKGIILHFLIGFIHPFNDGNGRTARTIFYWYLLSRGYWLFEFMAISKILLRSKKRYGLAYLYTETDEEDLTYFIKYNLEAIEEALNDTLTYIQRKQAEQKESIKMIKGIKDINLRQADILKELMKKQDSWVSIKEMQNTYATAYDTARNDLLHLETKGYLEKRKIKRAFLFRIKKKIEDQKK